MKALLHANGPSALGETLGISPWVLLPVGNRPLFEYWIELCVGLGIHEIRVLLGEGGEQVEAYAGTGARWGVAITYGFEKEGAAPMAFLARDVERWTDGLLHIRGPCFPRRAASFSAETLAALPAGCLRAANSGHVLFCGTDGDAIRAYINGDAALGTPLPGLTLTPLETAADYHALCMCLVGEEGGRYVAPGYEVTADGCYIGSNTIMPASAKFAAPVMIGNDTRIQPVTEIGPNAVIGNHVVIDTKTELRDCVILDNTYVGRNLEIKGKVVSGNRLIDPETDTCLELNDPWLLDTLRPVRRLCDAVAGSVGKLVALLMVLLQCIPYLVMRRILPSSCRGVKKIVQGRDARPVALLVFEGGSGKRLAWFQRLLLDRFPRFLLVLEGRLWLCGQAPLDMEAFEAHRQEFPEYLPAAITYADSMPRNMRMPESERIEAAYYLHMRSLAEDMRIFGRAVVYRLTNLS